MVKRSALAYERQLLLKMPSCPAGKGVLPMDTYVTWPELVQVIALIVDVIGVAALIMQIKKK